MDARIQGESISPCQCIAILPSFPMLTLCFVSTFQLLSGLLFPTAAAAASPFICRHHRRSSPSCLQIARPEEGAMEGGRGSGWSPLHFSASWVVVVLRFFTTYRGSPLWGSRSFYPPISVSTIGTRNVRSHTWKSFISGPYESVGEHCTFASGPKVFLLTRYGKGRRTESTLE